MAGKIIRLIFGLAELSHKLKNSAMIRLNTKLLRLKFSWLQTISAELLNLNWNDCQRKWCTCCCLFFDVTKPSSIYNHKKFRNHEDFTSNNKLSNLLGCWFHFIIRISVFFRRIKFGGEFGYRRRLGGLIVVYDTTPDFTLTQQKT